jgi:protein-S-isoprenylcysteine O-methyltransferase Ste14
LPFLARPVALGLGLTLVAVGGLFIVTSIPTMLRGHGTLNTAGPSAALVVSGPYAFSRNPMYLGLVLVYSGLACLFAVTWAIPIVLLLVLYTQLGVIAPEERYLDRAFGDSYRAYRSRVRRWL